MATQGNYITETFVAGAALTPFTFATVNASGQAVVPAAGAAADLVVETGASAAGRPVAGAVFGRVKVVAGGTIAVGANVATNASGRVVAATTGNVILGKALEAGVNNQIITIDFFKGGNASA